MVYKGNIPQPTDKLSASQPEILENYNQLGLLFAIDHASLTDATVANRGKHEQATLLHKAADASTAAGEGAIYTVMDGTTQYLRYREESDGTVYNLATGGTDSIVFAYATIHTTWGGAFSIAKQRNIASITKLSDSTFSFLFTTPASDAEYAIVCSGNPGATSTGVKRLTQTANGATIQFTGATSSAKVYLVVYGG